MKNVTIQQLVDDLEPVQRLHPNRAISAIVIITAVFMLFVVMVLGPREDIMSGRPDPMFLMRSGILLLLGLANAGAVIGMASPAVGRHNNSWQIAVAAASLFPLAAIILAMSAGFTNTLAAAYTGMECLRMSAVGGLAIAIPIILFLRRGAPTSPERAGWLTGIASGGLGAFAYNFHCPFNDLIYTGTWYTIAVGICAVTGRAIVPRLIRW